MLARYAYLYREELKLSQVPSKTISKIQYLLAYRQRLVKSKVALEVAAKELAAFTDKVFSSSITKDSQKHIKQLTTSISSIDKQLVLCGISKYYFNYKKIKPIRFGLRVLL